MALLELVREHAEVLLLLADFAIFRSFLRICLLQRLLQELEQAPRWLQAIFDAIVDANQSRSARRPGVLFTEQVLLDELVVLQDDRLSLGSHD